MNKSCSIFFYEGYVGVAPTIINLSKVLRDHGYKVTIYATKNNYAVPGDLGENIEVIYFLKGTRLFEFLKSNGVKDIIPLLEMLFYIFPCFWHFLRSWQPGSKHINIGVDLYGGITGYLLSLIFRQKFLLLSLELYGLQKFSGISTFLGDLFKLSVQESEAILIQDEDRFKTFCQYYEYDHPDVFYLPNSSLSESNLKANSTTNYFREKFNLSQEQFPCLVLQAGMIADAVYSQTLAEVFTQINNYYALVFHDRQPRQEDPYILCLRKINSRNLFLSLEPLPYNEIDRIYSAADIGLAFYQEWGDNMTKISMASGKLSQYLKHGKPILVNNLPSLALLVEKYQIGVVVDNPADAEEIKSALEKIRSDYPQYSRNAKLCFDAEFDFGKKAEPILTFLDSL